MQEIWKDIEGYEGIYQVSNLGRVKSIREEDARGHKLRIRFLTPSSDCKGYFRVNLYKDGAFKTIKLHRLVAQAFIPNPNNLPEINHISEDKSQNEASNLEWCTTKYNHDYGTRTQRCRESVKVPVNQYDMLGNFLRTFKSAKDVENILGISRCMVTNCCRKRAKSAGGFIWDYC